MLWDKRHNIPKESSQSSVVFSIRLLVPAIGDDDAAAHTSTFLHGRRQTERIWKSSNIRNDWEMTHTDTVVAVFQISKSIEKSSFVMNACILYLHTGFQCQFLTSFFSIVPIVSIELEWKMRRVTCRKSSSHSYKKYTLKDYGNTNPAKKRRLETISMGERL